MIFIPGQMPVAGKPIRNRNRGKSRLPVQVLGNCNIFKKAAIFFNKKYTTEHKKYDKNDDTSQDGFKENIDPNAALKKIQSKFLKKKFYFKFQHSIFRPQPEVK